MSWIHWGLLEAGRVQVLSRGPASTPAQEGSALLHAQGFCAVVSWFIFNVLIAKITACC